MPADMIDIVVIGGGASGLMLAAGLDVGGYGVSGLILEGGSRPGSKLLMSGGGRCNITHGGSVKDFVYAYGDAGPALRRCLYRHSNLELAGRLDTLGVGLADENGVPIDMSRGSAALDGAGRIFPASMKAKDVLDALLSGAARNMWQLETDAKVCGLARKADEGGDPVWEIGLAGRGRIYARNVVAASGGITYPETGSDGSMLDILKSLGVEVTPPKPALAPVYVRDYPYSGLSGISVPDVSVTVFGSDAACTCKGRAAKMRGDLLFTREGLSGPVILNVSGRAEPGEIIRLSYNKRLEELPKRMQAMLKERAKGPSGDVRTTVLASLLDHDDFIVSGIDGRGMVTAGGVALSEIDMSTMQVRSFADKNDRARGTGALYVIGEAIDADGITGGYNLQLCWSTALTAADSISGTLQLCSQKSIGERSAAIPVPIAIFNRK